MPDDELCDVIAEIEVDEGLEGDNLKRGMKPDVGIVRVAIEVGTASAMLGLSKHTPDNGGFIVSHRSLLG